MLLNYYSYASLNLLNHQQLISEVTYTCTICNVLSQYFLDIFFQCKLNSFLLLIRPCLIFFKQIEKTEAEVVEPTKEELPFTFKGKFEPPTFSLLIHLSTYP